MIARNALRKATAASHARVDAAFSRFRLDDADDYRRFLLAQAAGFLPVEAALDEAEAERLIPHWAERRRASLLRADLAALNVTAPELFGPPPIFSSKASRLGATYVLEGSRLGGALLKRQVPKSFPRRFLDARQLAGSWRKLLETLDLFLIRQGDLELAARAANEVFARFEQGAEAQLEAR